MSLVRMINGLINDIGVPEISEANIKGRLIKLREKVKAQESRLKDLEAEIVKFEAQAKKKKLAPRQRGLDEDSAKILKLIARDEALTVGQIAQILRIPKIEAEHHKNALRGAKLIEVAGEYVDEVGDTGELLWKLSKKGVTLVLRNSPKKPQ